MTGVTCLSVDRCFSELVLGKSYIDYHNIYQTCKLNISFLYLGEASRMLAWLIKNGRSGELMRNIVREDGIQPLVSMVTSEHIVMQNEALVALTLISSSVLGICKHLALS